MCDNLLDVGQPVKMGLAGYLWFVRGNTTLNSVNSPGSVADVDAATVLLYDNVVAHRQAKPGTFPGRLGSEERVEYFLFDLFRDSGAAFF